MSPFPTLPIDFESFNLALFNFAFKAFASLSSAGTAGSNRTRLGGPPDMDSDFAIPKTRDSSSEVGSRFYDSSLVARSSSSSL